MGQAKIVDMAFIKIVKRQLDELLAGSYQDGSPLKEKLQSIRHKMDIITSVATDAPLELVPGATKQQLVDALGLKVYDFAIPEGWADGIREKMGFNTVWHFVWCYDKSSFGYPVPITAIGRAMLPVINKVMGTAYPEEY